MVVVMVAVFMLIIGSVAVCVLAFVVPARFAEESVFREKLQIWLCIQVRSRCIAQTAAHTRLALLDCGLHGRLSFVEYANDRVELDIVSAINLMLIKDTSPLTVKRFFPMLVAEKPCIKARPAGMLRPLPFLLFLEALLARPPRLGSVSSPESLSGGGGFGATIAFFARLRSRLSSKPVAHMGQNTS